MTVRQLDLVFESAFARVFEVATVATASLALASETVVSKTEYRKQIATLWQAVHGWMLDLTPATEFYARSLGVYQNITPETDGSFDDANEVHDLTEQYSIAAGVAIAAEEAAAMMSEHGHPENADPAIRAYYFALALSILGYDLEHYLRAIPPQDLLL